MTMIDEGTDERKVTALLIQKLNGEDTYMVWRQDADGRQHYQATDSRTFWAIHAQAGEPTYTEHNYWSYEAQS